MKFTLPYLIAFVLLFNWSCRKDSVLETTIEEQSDFWAYTPRKDSKVTISSDSTGADHYQSILPIAIADLKKMKITKEFQKAVTRLGFPLWDASIEFFDADSVKTLLVPIADSDEKTVTALLVVNYLNNYSYFQYHIVERGNYPTATGKNEGKKLMPVNQWDGLFAALDEQLYNLDSSVTHNGPKKGSAKVSYYEQVVTNNGCVAAGNSDWYCTYTYSFVWVSNDLGYGSESSGGSSSVGYGSSTGSPTSQPAPLPEEEDNTDYNPDNVALPLNKVCSSSFKFITIVVPDPDQNSRGWKEASIKNLTFNTTASNYLENIFTIITTGSSVVTANINLEVGAPGDLPAHVLATATASALNITMAQLEKSYGFEGLKTLIMGGQINSTVATLMQIQLNSFIPGSRVSSSLSGRTIPTTPVIGMDCK